MAELGLILVHSPLLGAFSWRDVASRLRADGYTAIVPDFTPVMLKQPPLYRKIADSIAMEVESLQGNIVLVGHSGAGALLPVVAAAVGRRARGLMFVDAILPHPGKTWFDTVPADLTMRLKAQAAEGFLPPWHEWWPPQVMARLLPDDVLRMNFVEKLRRRPLAYFNEKALDVEVPRSMACGYLQLSSAYEAEAIQARAAGWSVDHYPLGHLAMVTDAGAVASLIQDFATNLEGKGRSAR
jgi:pimeloyl-ACP methyl ester carboxylesterase